MKSIRHLGAFIILALLTTASAHSQTQTIIAYWNGGSPYLAVSASTLISAFQAEWNDGTTCSGVSLLISNNLMYIVGRGTTSGGNSRVHAFELIRDSQNPNNMYVGKTTAQTWHKCEGVCCTWCELNVVTSNGTSSIQGCLCNTTCGEGQSGYCNHSTGNGQTGYIGTWY